MEDADFSFENLHIWKANRDFIKTAYRLCNKLPREELFGLSSQIKRAASSVNANYVEGHSRYSLKERMHFYEIAYGSLMETYCHFITANDVGYDITQEDLDVIKAHVNHVAALICGLRNACLSKL